MRKTRTIGKVRRIYGTVEIPVTRKFKEYEMSYKVVIMESGCIQLWEMNKTTGNQVRCLTSVFFSAIDNDISLHLGDSKKISVFVKDSHEKTNVDKLSDNTEVHDYEMKE